ncbi:MAG: hypothetical protein JW841_00250 [Deltaproteobacteria bacterium]|nr:hypothetical protein [Deltaproteobacteria bacterium]
MNSYLSPRELAYCGLFGAASLLLPVLFHMLQLGHVFMPMYLPLCTLPFFIRPLPAAITAIIVPLLSAALTGMPPFYPPIAIMMAIELSVMAALISFIYRHITNANEWIVLIPVLLIGRVLYAIMFYAFSNALNLPAGFLAIMASLRGWPGIILMIIVIPPLVRMVRKSAWLKTNQSYL